VAGAQAAATCPDDCAPTEGPPRKGHQSWLRHRQLVIRKRSPEYQALRGAGRIDTGTSTRRIDEPCADWRWNRQYYAWRRLLHRLVVVSPCPPGSPPRVGASTDGVCLAPRGCGALLGKAALPPVRRGRGGQAGPATPCLGGGGLSCPTRPGAGSALPPGQCPCDGCLLHARQPPLPGLLDQGRGRVRPCIGLPERGRPVGEPPIQPPRRGGDQDVAGGLPDAGRLPGVVRPRVPVVGGPVRPLPQELVLPRGKAGLPEWGHGTYAGPR